VVTQRTIGLRRDYNIMARPPGARTLDHTPSDVYLARMSNVHCVRCGIERERMSFQPFQNDIGKRAYEEICAVCWGEWTKMQQQLINHYALNLRDPKAKEFLFRNMEQFLFKPGQVGT
jgi:Fe-S cluster biosynthesis and repair protein YggX